MCQARARVALPRPADLEVGATAGLETCATPGVAGSVNGPSGTPASALSRNHAMQPQMHTDKHSAACAAATGFGVRREAKRHAAFGSRTTLQKEGAPPPPPAAP